LLLRQEERQKINAARLRNTRKKRTALVTLPLLPREEEKDSTAQPSHAGSKKEGTPPGCCAPVNVAASCQY
jgi:hypothetical protein